MEHIMLRRRKNKKMKELDFSEYVELFKKVVPKPERVDKQAYRGRCPICGDSKQSRSKKRLYLIQERGSKPSVVYCHNCGLSMSAYSFFDKHFTEFMKEYKKGITEKDLKKMKEFVETGKVESPSLFQSTVEYEEINPERYNTILAEEVKRAKKVVGNFFDSCTISIQDNQTAYEYMKNRFVPEHKIEEMRLLHPDFHDRNKFRFAYFRDYIIIPFIDDSDNQPYYFHSRRYRNLDGKFARYLSCPYKPEEVDVDFFLNEFRIDTNKPVVVNEGTIDSMHIENTLATNGVNKITDEQIERFEYRYGGPDNIIYALDNEMIDFDARKKAKELLKKGKRVFLWSLLAKKKSFIAKIKDFNTLCCKAGRNMIPLSTIEEFTTTNPALLL
jgi:transcription elongation factor Elf1